MPIQLTKNFTKDEFMCSCCAENEINQEFVEKLQELRDLYGKRIRVVSGYRCQKHNAKVGGVPNSTHTKGIAADISGDDLDGLYKCAQDIFLAVGDGRRRGFIHVDNRRDKVRRWNY